MTIITIITLLQLALGSSWGATVAGSTEASASAATTGATAAVCGGVKSGGKVLVKEARLVTPACQAASLGA